VALEPLVECEKYLAHAPCSQGALDDEVADALPGAHEWIVSSVLMIGGRFTELAAVSRGGTGSVFRALDGRSGEPVAVKILYGGSVDDADRLEREVDALAAAAHPAVVRYVDHGRTEEGELYLAMEWLDGETLADRLRRGRLEIAEAVALAGRLADALAAAHVRGVVHRDLKPHNVILAGSSLDEPKLVDFGLAKLERARALTLPGSIMGTPAYMAPEQARGARDIDARADVFALGCVLYECLCGHPPFRGDDPWAVLAKVVLEEPAPVMEVRPGVPTALDELISDLLAKSPGNRPDAAGAAARLAAIRDGTAGARGVAGPAVLTGAEKRLISLIVCDIAPLRPLATDATLAATPLPVTPIPFDGDASLAGTLTRMRAIAQPYGGYIERVAAGHLVGVLHGDGVAADLASQAARCALALRARLGAAPIVLATGAAMVVGRLPVGDIIDRAARLLAAGIEPDESGRLPVVLDEVTAGLLAPSFVAGQRGARIELWSERRGAPPVRTLLGKPAPFVGRDREVLTVEASLAEAMSESVARAVLVTGPPGAGKSRLRHELLTRAAGRGLPAAWIGRGDPVSAGSPFGILADALRGALDLADGQPLDEQREQLRARVDPAIADFLGELVGVPFAGEPDTPLHAARRDAALMGDRLRAAFEAFLRERTEHGPVVIVLEDLHWGDLPSVRLVESALRNLSGRPLFVLALGRPDVHDRFPALWEDLGCVHVPLTELSRRAGERLVRSVLPDVADDAVARILDRAAGNAFLLEELTRATAEGWGDLPATVRAVAQARFDGLDTDARRVLRAASVFGATFWAGGVAHLLGDASAAPNVRALLERLAVREVLTRRQTSRIAGEREMVFRHVLLREAAYESFAEADRRLGHRLAGEWLEAHGERDPMLFAEHFDRAGLPERAAAGYLRAAADALAGNDVRAAIERADRGTELTVDPRDRGHLRVIAAEAHRWLGDYAAAEEACRDAMVCLASGTELWIEAAGRRGEVASLLGKVALAEEMAAELIEAPREPSARDAWVIGCTKLAARLTIDDHHATVGRLLAAVDTLDPSELSGIARAWRARAHACDVGLRGDRAGAAANMGAAADEFEHAGDERNAIVQRLNQVEFLADVGLLDEAERRFAALLPRVAPISDILSQHAITVRALLAAVGNHPEDVLAIPMAQLEAIGYPRAPFIALCDIAEAHRRLGDLDTAERWLALATEKLRRFPAMLPAVAAVSAAVLLDRGRPAEALAVAHAALEVPPSWTLAPRRARLVVVEQRAAAFRA
jgi:tetratricopeptide (TPR) repeat protein